MNKIDYYELVSVETLKDFNIGMVVNLQEVFQMGLFLTNELIVPLDQLLIEVLQ